MIPNNWAVGKDSCQFLTLNPSITFSFDAEKIHGTPLLKYQSGVQNRRRHSIAAEVYRQDNGGHNFFSVGKDLISIVENISFQY